MDKVRTCLWFDGTARDAACFYVSLIPGSDIEGMTGKAGDQPLVVNFRLGDTPYQAINGGPQFRHSPAASICVLTEDQEETDRLWAALTEGGEESRCAWLVDSYGVSWQIVPRQLLETVGGPDDAGAARATEAMLKMSKIDIAMLQAAYRGD